MNRREKREKTKMEAGDVGGCHVPGFAKAAVSS